MATKKWIGTDGAYSTSGNWSPSGVPTNSDTVVLPAGGSAISTGLNQSAVALTAFIVEEGYTGTIGSSTAPLQIGTSRFEFKGTGLSYIDLGSSSVSPQIFGTATAATGKSGLYLIGSAMSKVSVSGNSALGIAANATETATVTTLETTSDASTVNVGRGVSLTTLTVTKGKVLLNCAATTVNCYGTLYTGETGAITTLNVYDGTAYANSTGTITTANLYGGMLEMRQSAALRTVTTVNIYAGCEFSFDPNVVTLTNDPNIMEPMTIQTTAA